MTKIEYFGHSCFRITADNGYRIVLDPYADGSVPGLKLPADIEAEEVLCSHDHSDHNGRQCIRLSKRDIENPFTIEKLVVPHDDAEGAKRGMSAITILNVDGKKIVHYGDLGRPLTSEEIQKLSQADVAMIPCGGYFTIDSRQAAKIIEETRPKLTLAMHLRNGSAGYEVLENLDQIKKNIPSLEILNASSVVLGNQQGILFLKAIQ